MERRRPLMSCRLHRYTKLLRLGTRDDMLVAPQAFRLMAYAYARYGFIVIALISFFTFLGFLLALKNLGWNTHKNVFAIFFFNEFVIVYAGQGSLGQYAGAPLRGFPLFVIVFWLLSAASRLRWRRTKIQERPRLTAGWR